MTHASVFSGIGGPEVAAAMLGWENLFHCEINPFGRAVLDYWFPNSESYEDITKTDFSKWRGRVDVLTGGFPCQPFSFAGKRRGADDDRYLWPYMFRCIDQIRPTWVIGENVAGILSMVEQGEVTAMEDQTTLLDEDGAVHRYEYRGTFTLERICSDLEAHGYEVQPVLIPACAVGAPHKRDRVFIIGHRIGEDTDLQGRPVRGSGEGCAQHGCGRTAEHASGRRAEMQNDPSRSATDERQGFGEVGRTVADTESIGQLDRDRQERSAVAGRQDMAQTERRVNEAVGNGEQESPADTSEQSGERMRLKQSEVSGAQQVELERISSEGCGIAGCGRWDSFPSVPAIHRGNDGLPFDVDDITLPFDTGNTDPFIRWRSEALKAYGNAIVPQVMYEIFRAIEMVENPTPKSDESIPLT